VSIILLVRHGQASFGSADYDLLSSLGEEQARLLGAALASRGIRPDVVVSGSMKRHRQTAAETLEAAGWDLPLVEDDDWDEYDHLTTLSGSVEVEEFLEGESYEDLVVRQEAAIERWASGRHDHEYDESFPEFQQRITRALERLVADLGAKQTAVVFTSGGPVSWVAASLSHGGVPVWARLSNVVVNAGVTKVLTGRRGTNLISFNDHSHLETGDAALITYR
jgi:broad specificity phosphatase PhoE